MLTKFKKIKDKAYLYKVLAEKRDNGKDFARNASARKGM